MKLNNNIALLYIILLHTPDSILTKQSKTALFLPLNKNIYHYISKQKID